MTLVSVYDTGLAPGGGGGGGHSHTVHTSHTPLHPLTSLLNVIDFESKSETDKTARIKAIASATARNPPPPPPPPPPTHTLEIQMSLFSPHTSLLGFSMEIIYCKKTKKQIQIEIIFYKTPMAENQN